MRSISVLAGSVLVITALSSTSTTTNQAADFYGKKAVTSNRDVAPIFYQHCVACHQPEDIAPMSLLTYQDARAWAKSIREQVVSRQMPPWRASPRRRLKRSGAPVDEGAKEGAAQDLPPAPPLTDGWKMGQPDVVIGKSKR